MSGSARAHDGAESWPKKRSRRKGSGKKTSVCEKQEKRGCPDAAESALSVLPDLTDRLIKCGNYEEYLQWREGYRRWREGNAEGAHGEGAQVASHAATTEGPLRLEKSWRDGYRSWRKGGTKGAQGKMEAMGQRSDELECKPMARNGSRRLPLVIYDVIMTADGESALVPSDGPEIAPMAVKDFPEEAVLTVRVFRFLEDRSDEKTDWEERLLNVNSGSIFWLPWQLAPNMHTKAGAKYGTWFTVHYVQVFAKHFNSAYHMCNEGFTGGAKTFGSSGANKKVTGEKMPEGYFWYVSPAAGQEHLRIQDQGWQHLDREGPYDGKAFIKLWQEQGSPMQVRALQDMLAKVVEASVERKLT